MPLALVVPLLAVVAAVPFSDPIPGPAPRNQYAQRAASDGKDYLALWNDHRANPSGTYATRVTSDGRVLDPTGIRIAEEDMFSPTVTWSGTSYLIAWTRGEDFWLMRIDRDGVIVDGPRRVLARAQPRSSIFNGRHVVVGYSVAGNETHALFLTSDGEVVRDVKLADGGDIGALQLAWNGTHFAAVWLAQSASYTILSVDGVTFTIDGTLTPVRRLLHDVKQNQPRLASDGRDFLLLMYDDNVFRQFARHVSADLATVGDAVVLPPPLRDSAMAHWIRDHYVVTGDNGPVISGVRLDHDGRLLDAEARSIVQIPDGGSGPGSVSVTNGDDLLITWAGAQHTPDRDEPLDIYGATASGSTLDRTSSEMLSVAAPRQYLPAVASSGTGLLTVWREHSGLYARRNDLDGRAIDATPIRLANLADAATATFNGTDYVVAWTGYDAQFKSELVTRRIPLQGALRMNGGTRVPLDVAAAIALASDGNTTLLTWASRDGLKAARLSSDASFRDTVPLTLTDDRTVGSLAIAPNDAGEFLIAWGETYFTEHGGMNPVNVRAARVTSGFTNLDAGGFAVAETPAAEGHPSVAWNGSEWLVAWQSNDDIRGRRVASNGTLLDDDSVLIATGARYPYIAWANGYTIAWTDAFPRYGPTPIRAAHFSHLGAPLTSITTLGEAEVFPRSAFLIPVGGRVVAAYARIAREPQYGGVMRAFLSKLDGSIETPRRRRMRH